MAATTNQITLDPEDMQLLQSVLRRPFPKSKQKLQKSEKGELTAAQVTDPKMIADIVAARKSGLSFMKIEEKFNLKRARGMTAVRVVKKGTK